MVFLSSYLAARLSKKDVFESEDRNNAADERSGSIGPLCLSMAILRDIALYVQHKGCKGEDKGPEGCNDIHEHFGVLARGTEKFWGIPAIRELGKKVHHGISF